MSSQSTISQGPPARATLWGRALVLAIAVGAIAWFAFFAKSLLLKYPPVGPDEAFFADPAINLAHHGSMSTDLLDGTMPGIGQRTYWMPPVYFLYLAAIFRFSGDGVVAVRLASIAAALAALVLTYLVALRTGLGRWISLLAPALVAIDAVFLRGALMGRMDMLALAFILLALWLATGPAGLWNSFFTGMACALAVLTHPIGVVAGVSVLGWRLAWRDTRTLRALAPLLAGMIVPMLAWLAYIAQDPSSFLAQFGGQLIRKSVAHPSLDLYATCLYRLVAQYTFANGRLMDAVWALPLWILGILGLGDAEVRTRGEDSPARRSLFLLYACQFLIMLAVFLSNGEMWYALYVIPITAIGLCHLVNNCRPITAFSLRTVATGVVVLWIGGFVLSNLQHVARLNHLQNVVRRSETDYAEWSAEISRRIPLNSTLLLSIIPDPYFGLRSRSDLSLRECLPDRIPVDRDAYWQYMSQADYVILGAGFNSPTLAVQEFLRSHGTLVDSVGNADTGYFARVYRVNKPNPVASQAGGTSTTRSAK